MDKGAQMRGIRTMYPKDESLMTWHLFKGGAAGIIQRFAKEVRAKGGHNPHRNPGQETDR